ncbi:GNAT family N-acetyltransferase [Virgibacillus phasianinus]|uniref:GNAT family N-acetyltransferase n=1 Tax=Virgibacillus phasianinus TaxID=2017483 RepID=A0A220TZ57_9BACI|nr:GNAT family N-acetyltransferase [Virgibacillus phasianinus]ASK61294.1 GNAT family N-acetyltransferase [Virgibacillus phasianinus]
MEWHLKEFKDLSNNELYGIMKARVDVFVVEQECAYEEIDNYDQTAIHYFLTVENEIAAYVRILPSHTKYEEVSIGRVLVTKNFRGNGYAKMIMKKAIQYVTDVWKVHTIKLQAQQYLHRFYSELGFLQHSDVYLDDDIPHIDMFWRNNQ